jgi:secreted trypsin-like serine protease
LPPTFQDDFEKYKAAVRLLELNSTLSGSGMSSAKFSNNPGNGGGTCYGDSGGPVFYKDTQVVVAVTSFGWAKHDYCVGNDFSYRTDIAASQEFLEAVLEEYGD